jgi:hypothetical protein
LLIAPRCPLTDTSPGSDDDYAKPNAQLEKWIKEVAEIKVTMERFAVEVRDGGPKIRGLTAAYQGSFKKHNADWRIRRYAMPDYGDVLLLARENGGEFELQESVRCPKEGIRRKDVETLLREVTKK